MTTKLRFLSSESPNIAKEDEPDRILMRNIEDQLSYWGSKKYLAG